MSHGNTSDAVLAEWIGRAEPAIPPSSAAAIIETLQQSQLLTAAQANELSVAEKQGKFPDYRTLARELVERGWLTPFQANLVLQGRAADLVQGPYLLIERIGEGGTGQVFKARHLRMQRVLALKVIRRELVADAETVGRFYRETQVISKLSHPNLVHAYDAGPLGPTHFLAMEFVEGTDLARLVKKAGPLPVWQACDYLRQAALGLQHIHEHGLVHRDIKPSNLMLSSPANRPSSPGQSTKSTADGRSMKALVKLLDLGLARLQEQAHGKSTTHLPDGRALTTLSLAGPVTLGTIDYLSPEQALDFHSVDIRADIYSLGCTFFYLLTGKPPFPTGTVVQKLMKHQQSEPPSLAEGRPDAPAGLEAILRRMLAKRAEDRFATPAEIIQALDALPLPRGPVTTLSAGERQTRLAPARKRPFVLVAGLALLLLAGMVGWFVVASNRTNPTSRGTLVAQLQSQPKTEAPGRSSTTTVTTPPPKTGTAPPKTAPANVVSKAPTGKTTDRTAEKILRGRTLVRDALIDPMQPDRKFGTLDKDNALRRDKNSNVFLVRFGLGAAGLTAQSKIARATFSFFVWDPHDRASTRVRVYPLKTAWDEATVTWKQPADGQKWQGGDAFDLKADSMLPMAQCVVKPDLEKDTVDPPVEYQVDVTAILNVWLLGNHPNHGLVLVPTEDRAIDDGHCTRFQIYASKHPRVQYTPTLKVELAP